MTFDINKIKEGITEDLSKDQVTTGIDIRKITFNIYDLTDFDSLNELEAILRGRRVISIKTIDVPHVVVVSVPSTPGNR